MRYHGILFDLDGTLGDTLALCVAAFHQAVEPLIGRSLSDAEIMASFGPSEEGAVRSLAPDRPDESLAAYLERYEAMHGAYPDPFDGVRTLLDRIHAAGVRVGVVTGKGPRTAAITLDRFGLTFDDLETGSPEGPCKPEGIREIVARWEVEPSRVLYVGDAVSDVHAAREAGVDIAAAAWAGTADPEALKAAEPDALFRSVAGLTRWLFPEDADDSAHLNRLAQRVQSMAQTGLAFSNDRYDIERYETLREVAVQMMSYGDPSGQAPLLDAFKAQEGYTTPKVDVRAIVLRDGQILLAREASDGLWSLPGGWADVGDRPSEAIEREVREETGLEVRATRLLGVWDRNLHGHPPHAFHVYKLFFLCEEMGGTLTLCEDTLELGFFAPDARPLLSLDRVVPEEIEACVALAASGGSAYFD